MNFLIRHKMTFIFLSIAILIYFISPSNGVNVFRLAEENLISMLMVIPPIFILIALMDVWIKKETFIKHMGDSSGLKGLFLAFILGTIGAGPTYGAFPVATLLIKKGVRIANALFFLGIWSAVKLPIVIFEASSMGLKFTIIHILIMVLTYLIGAFLIEKLLSNEDKKELIENANNIK